MLCARTLRKSYRQILWLRPLAGGLEIRCYGDVWIGQTPIQIVLSPGFSATFIQPYRKVIITNIIESDNRKSQHSQIGRSDSIYTAYSRARPAALRPADAATTTSTYARVRTVRRVLLYILSQLANARASIGGVLLKKLQSEPLLCVCTCYRGGLKGNRDTAPALRNVGMLRGAVHARRSPASAAAYDYLDSQGQYRRSA